MAVHINIPPNEWMKQINKYDIRRLMVQITIDQKIKQCQSEQVLLSYTESLAACTYIVTPKPEKPGSTKYYDKEEYIAAVADFIKQ